MNRSLKTSSSIPAACADVQPQFTPGPWTIVQRDWADGYGFWWEIMAREAKTRVCELADTALPHIAWQRNGMGEIPPAENLMNAHLVAAAPDLYKALKSFYLEAQSYHSSCHEEDNEFSTSKCDAICACLPEAKAALAKAEGR